MNVLFIGGDKRSIAAYNTLKEKYNVTSLGLFENDDGDISAADVIILPIPTTRDGKTVNCSLTKRIIPLCDITKAPVSSHIFTYGYRFDSSNQTDYSALDDFCLKNAALTAEGAISAAISETEFSLWKSKILIIGFGRVGKLLLSRLMPFGAKITVTARKSADFGLLDSLGVDYAETAKAGEMLKEYDIIFNCVDVPLDCELNDLKNTYLFDLSSKGCIDYSKAEILKLKAKKLPAIPAKTSPITAGKIIAQTVENILSTSILKENR